MKKSLFLVLLLFITSEIFAIYTVEFSALGDYSMKGKTFYILPGDSNISEKDLDFKEYTKYVASYIILKGGIEIKDRSIADVCIFINYGIGESRPLVINNPIYGNTGVSSIRTTTDYYGNKTSTVSHKTGVVGYYKTTTEQYRRYMDIYAFDNKKFEEMLWKINIESTGSKNDLGFIVPYMMYACRYYIGKNSLGQQSVSYDEEKTNVSTNILMTWVASGGFRHINTIGSPFQERSSDAEKCGLKIEAIQTNENYTLVLIGYTGDERVKFSEDLCMVKICGKNRQEFKPVNVSVDLTKPISKKTRYILLEFGAFIDTDCYVIIRDFNRKNLYSWKTLFLE